MGKQVGLCACGEGPLTQDHLMECRLRKPAPAPLLEDSQKAWIEALSELSCCAATSRARDAVVRVMDAHHKVLTYLTRRLAGAEAQLASREQELLDTLNRLVDERGTLRAKAEAAEAQRDAAQAELAQLKRAIHE